MKILTPKLTITFAKYIVLVAIAISSTFAYSATNIDSNPDYAVGIKLQKELEQLLVTVAARADELANNPDVMYDLLDENLSKSIAFKKIVRRIMGKHFKGFTKKNRNDFLDSFKKNLFNVYARTFLDAKFLAVLPERYDILVTKKIVYSNKKKTRAIQNIVFLNTATNKKTQVNFSVYYSKKNKKWLIQNLIIGGINLGINYRTQFNKLFYKYKGDMDKIVADWSYVVVKTKEDKKATIKETSK